MQHDVQMEALQMDALFTHFDGVAEAGHLRRLSAAFARFIATLDEAGPDAPPWAWPAWCCPSWKGGATAA